MKPNEAIDTATVAMNFMTAIITLGMLIAPIVLAKSKKKRSAAKAANAANRLSDFTLICSLIFIVSGGVFMVSGFSFWYVAASYTAAVALYSISFAMDDGPPTRISTLCLVSHYSCALSVIMLCFIVEILSLLREIVEVLKTK